MASMSKLQPGSTKQGKPQPVAKKRELLLSDLTENSLYVVLFNYRDENDTFHWGLYLHEDADKGGWKFHIKNEGTASWITDHAQTYGVFKSMMLIGLMRVADVPPANLTEVQTLIKAEDSMVNTPGNSCRIYVKKACERLRDGGNMTFQSWQVLEREIMDWGNSEMEPTRLNVQPRSLTFSRVCGLTS